MYTTIWSDFTREWRKDLSVCSSVVLYDESSFQMAKKGSISFQKKIWQSTNRSSFTLPPNHGTCCSPCLAVCRSKTIASRVSRATRLTSRPALAFQLWVDWQDLDTWPRNFGMFLLLVLEIWLGNIFSKQYHKFHLFLHFNQQLLSIYNTEEMCWEIGCQDTISESHRPKPPLLGLLDPSCASSVGVREKDITVLCQNGKSGGSDHMCWLSTSKCAERSVDHV